MYCYGGQQYTNNIRKKMPGSHRAFANLYVKHATLISLFTIDENDR